MRETPAFLRIAHRGASGHCPENTRAAFVRAIELGADMVEIDCQMTRDGAVVVFHDDALDRTTNGRGPLRDKTLRELKALDAGSWFSPAFAGEEILTLEETVAILRGKVGLNLEMKGEAAPGRLEIASLGILVGLHFFDQTVFSSFSLRRLRALRDLSDEARIGVLVDAGPAAEQWLEVATGLRAEAIHCERSLAGRSFVAAAHELDLEVRVWSVNGREEMDALLDRGVDGIFTDYPERLLAATRAKLA